MGSKQDSSYDSDHENLTAGAFLGAATNIGGGGGGGGGSLDLIPAPSVGVGVGGGGGGGGLAPLTIPAPGSGVMSRSHNDVSRCVHAAKETSTVVPVRSDKPEMHFLQDAVRDARPGVRRVRHAEEGVVGRGGRPRGGDGGGGQDRGTLRVLPATDQQSRSHRGTRNVASSRL